LSARASAWLAWSACLMTGVLLSGAVVLAVISDNFDAYLGLFAVNVLSCALVGALIGWRKPGNAVGWILLGCTVCLALQEFAREYVTRGMASDSGSLLLLPTMAWLLSWIYVPGVVLLLSFLPLYFPNGRLPSSGWRWIMWATVSLTVAMEVVAAFAPGRIKDTGVVNPLGIEALRSLFGLLEDVIDVPYTLIILACVTSLLFRFRRAGGDERQQIKWLLYATAALPAWFLVNPLLSAAFPALSELAVFGLVDNFSMAGIPIAIGVAIFKYRLYDIDVIINRTLVYGALTAILVLFYVGGVISLQYAFRAVTGQGSTLAIVASTLAIAALFNPLRRRMQGFVDRRFYRRKYDAARTLEAFNLRLRDETDLDVLSDDLVGVVRGTVQPEHASLWLRPGSASRGQQAH
jgi:hypothetical protein